MKTVEIEVVKTCKGYSPKDRWQRYDREVQCFLTLAEAQKWIKNRYGKSKRSPMYVDDKDGKPIRVGWVIGFRSPACCPGDNPKLNQDWVSIEYVERRPAV